MSVLDRVSANFPEIIFWAFHSWPGLASPTPHVVPSSWAEFISCKNIETVICIWKVESLAPSFPISMYGTSSHRIKYLLLCSSSGTSKCQRVCTAAALLPPTRLFYFSPSPDNENREDWTGGNVPHLDFQRLWTPCNLSAAPVRFRYQDHPVWMTLTNIIYGVFDSLQIGLTHPPNPVQEFQTYHPSHSLIALWCYIHL